MGILSMIGTITNAASDMVEAAAGVGTTATQGAHNSLLITMHSGLLEQINDGVKAGIPMRAVLLQLKVSKEVRDQLLKEYDALGKEPAMIQKA